METRVQHFFLKPTLAVVTVCCLLCGVHARADDSGTGKIDTEFFELGFTAGVINIEDFTSEISVGLSSTFRATENFFLQFNWLKTDVSLSSVEESSQGAFTGSRAYQHYNFLLGYNLFQGEIFRGSRSGLSSFYGVIGVGDTEFLDESNFTYVYGLGYQTALSRRYTLRFDYRNYLYDSVVVSEDEKSTVNANFSVGLSWLF